MASLYRRDRSPYWWIKYRDGSGDIRYESTGCRIGIGYETAKARQLKAKRTQEEADTARVSNKEYFERWVVNFLETRYAKRKNTLTKYQQAWNAISAFLELRGLRRPRQVKREHVMEYLKWRQNPPEDSGFRAVSLNSALLDIRIWRIIMFEAIARELTVANPCSKLGIAADRPKDKHEITPKEEALIREKLKSRPPWMSISFEIAIHQGCRFSETCLPLTDVDLTRNQITFTIKGGRRHTTALIPALRPLFRRLKKEGRVMTYDMPPSRARNWHRFFRKIGLPHLSFHCTRVTVITRLARNGVPEQQTMRFIGHATLEVHRIYQKLKPGDLSLCVSVLNGACAA
jgi:integrase